MRSTIKCCADCTDRYVGCHATCEEYIRQKNEYENKKKIVHEMNNKVNNINLARIEGIKRMKTRSKSKVGY